MSNQALLSICIPTYNRGEMLKQSIQKMIPVCRDHHIQIFVSDNASPDNTEEVMNVLSGDYEFIHYHRHTENIGSDDNFEYVLKMADTKYRWLMSDTCYVEEIADLMSDLETTEWDGYILNDLPSRYSRARFLPKEKTIYEESISVMRDIGWHLTWISCMIYNERLVNTLNFERYKASSFNQTALMFETTANRPCKIGFNPQVAVMNLPISKESGWHYHVFDVVYRQWYLLIMSLPIYYPYEVKHQCVIDSASKPIMLALRFHLKRRMEGKWDWKDIYRNRFFIKQAEAPYLTLMIMGLCPKKILSSSFAVMKYLKNILWFH